MNVHKMIKSFGNQRSPLFALLILGGVVLVITSWRVGAQNSDDANSIDQRSVRTFSVEPATEPVPLASLLGETGSVAVLTAASSSDRAVVFPNPADLTVQNLVTLPNNNGTQGLDFYDTDRAILADSTGARLFVIEVSTASTLATISTSETPRYDGTGTIAVSPDKSVALASGRDALLHVIRAPFVARAARTQVTLPGSIPTANTQAIVFNQAGRAFVYTSGGISAIDPPYSSIAFTMPVITLGPRGLAISPDGETIIAASTENSAMIFDAPFSGASSPQVVQIPGSDRPDGVMFTPDGQKVLVASSSNQIVVAISAPFTPQSIVERIPLPTGNGFVGFEDIGISGDGQLAIFTGNGASLSTNRLVYARAPFGSSSVTGLVSISGVTNPGRGSGAVRFGRTSPVNPTPGNTDFDFDGDGRADLGVFRPAAQEWYIAPSMTGAAYGTRFGLATDTVAVADYDGDSKADITVWRDEPGDPDRATFYILQSSDNVVRVGQFGRTGDNPLLAGDWDGDGKAEPAVYRPGTGGGNGVFYYRPSSQPGTDFTAVTWGTAGDRPVRGDFDGDGKLDAAVFRPSDSIWYILQSSNGLARYESWGIASDKLVASDYDGDGKTDVAVFRNGIWYIKQSSNGQPRSVQFGLSSDVLVPADYDGDGSSDIAVYRGGVWYVARSTAGFAAFGFGLATDKPIPALNN